MSIKYSEKQWIATCNSREIYLSVWPKLKRCFQMSWKVFVDDADQGILRTVFVKYYRDNISDFRNLPNMADRGGKFSLFHSKNVRADIRISIRPMITKFGQQVHFQQTLTIHWTTGEGREPYFIPPYHFHPLLNFQTFICKFSCEMTTAYLITCN